MNDQELIQIPVKELLDMVDKMDRVVELLLPVKPESIALDVALLDLRDSARTLADRIHPET